MPNHFVAKTVEQPVYVINVSKSIVGDLSQGWLEGSFFGNYYTKV